MKKIVLLLTAVVFSLGCSPQNQDPRVHLDEDVGAANLGTNVITRPLTRAVSDLVGQGLTVMDITKRTGSSGFTEVYITLKNDSYRTKRFEYKFEWLDSDGAMVDTKTSVWLPYSIAGNATSTIKGVAPRQEAVDFRVVTRKVE